MSDHPRLMAKVRGKPNWTEQEKATHLAISLRGSALTVLTNLPEEQHSDFSALSAALKNRFGNNHQAELSQAQSSTSARPHEEEGRDSTRAGGRCRTPYQARISRSS